MVLLVGNYFEINRKSLLGCYFVKLWENWNSANTSFLLIYYAESAAMQCCSWYTFWPIYLVTLLPTLSLVL